MVKKRTKYCFVRCVSVRAQVCLSVSSLVRWAYLFLMLPCSLRCHWQFKDCRRLKMWKRAIEFYLFLNAEHCVFSVYMQFLSGSVRSVLSTFWQRQNFAWILLSHRCPFWPAATASNPLHIDPLHDLLCGGVSSLTVNSLTLCFTHLSLLFGSMCLTFAPPWETGFLQGGNELMLNKGKPTKINLEHY